MSSLPQKILVTGASGFIGSHLLARITTKDFQPLAVLRSSSNKIFSDIPSITIADLSYDTDWSQAMEHVSVVIHTAARVHVMSDRSVNPLAEFRKVNVDGTLNLARQAATAGVRRFIFVSSIKVNGEGTPVGKPYFADTQAAPVDPYGISKMEAEQGLRTLAAETGMEVVIIRPTLVYGPGVKANFLSMMRWLYKGVPLPLGAIDNRRSLVSLDNLVDLIVTCINHPSAANQTFLVSDGEDISTTELLRRMGLALGKPARLLPVPSQLLKAAATVLGKQAFSQRLCGSLQVDISKTRELLDWTPPVSVDEALHSAAKHFLEQQNK